MVAYGKRNKCLLPPMPNCSRILDVFMFSQRNIIC